MLGLLKRVILVNAVLSLLFVVSNLYIWSIISWWSTVGIASNWSPIAVSAYFYSGFTDPPTLATFPMLNLPFMLFWVMLAVNLYFIIILQRSKERNKP